MREEIARFLESERADLFLPRGAVVEVVECKVSVRKATDWPQATIRVRFGLV
jgi:hypothetical protein